MSGGDLVAGESKYESIDAIVRRDIEAQSDDFLLMVRNQMRLAKCQDRERVKPSEATAAFNALAPYFLKKPSTEVEHTHNVQHQLAATPLTLTMLGLKSSKQIERMPDGTTVVHEVVAIEAEPAEFEVTEGGDA